MSILTHKKIIQFFEDLAQEKPEIEIKLYLDKKFGSKESAPTW